MEDKIKLCFLAGVQVGEYIFFSAWNMNGLFKYNPKTDECNFIKSFPGEENVGTHTQAILYKDEIWFIPSASERIAIVDITTLDITYLELPESGYRTDEEQVQTLRIKGCYQAGEKYLWLLPHVYKLFIKIDMEKREIICVEQWNDNRNVGAGGIRIKDKLLIYRTDYAELCIMDDYSENHTVRKLEKEKDSYKGIFSDDNRVLFFPSRLKDGVLVWNNDTEKIKFVQLEDDGQMYDECQTYTQKGDILLVPCLGNKCVRIRLEKEKCFVIETNMLDVGENAYCSKRLLYDDDVWFLPFTTDNPIVCYVKEEDAIQYRYIEICKREYNEDILNSVIRYGIEYCPLANGQVINEQNILLNSFLQFIRKENNVNDIVEERQIGNYIYDSIK